jgi:hypothetical protein
MAFELFGPPRQLAGRASTNGLVEGAAVQVAAFRKASARQPEEGRTLGRQLAADAAFGKDFRE